MLEASGPVAEWSDIDGIVEQWDDPTADRSYLERVWLNRLVQSSDRAYDIARWRQLAHPGETIPAGALVALGFDGARYEDATALVATDVATGFMQVVGVWEKPLAARQQKKAWEVPEGEVHAAVAAAFERWDVFRLYADPPYWETAVSKWAGEYGAERALAWQTTRSRKMADACRSFATAIDAGEIMHDGNADLDRHVANAHKRPLLIRDEQGRALWTIQKERPDSPQKIDLCMAAILSWVARQDALAAGAGRQAETNYAVEALA